MLTYLFLTLLSHYVSAGSYDQGVQYRIFRLYPQLFYDTLVTSLVRFIFTQCVNVILKFYFNIRKWLKDKLFSNHIETIARVILIHTLYLKAFHFLSRTRHFNTSIGKKSATIICKPRMKPHRN